jgi:hypothetical protein
MMGLFHNNREPVHQGNIMILNQYVLIELVELPGELDKALSKSLLDISLPSQVWIGSGNRKLRAE